MFEVLSAGTEFPVDTIGWVVLLVSFLVAGVWVKYLYR